MTLRRTMLSLLLIVGVIAAMVTVASMAIFTDQVVSTNDELNAGTLYMSVDGDCADRDAGSGGEGGGEPCETTFELTGDVDAMEPGGTVTHEFTIVNEGSLDGLLSASAVVDPTDCFEVALDPALDDFPLASGATTTTTLTVTLPETADNQCQGATADLTVTFDLVQATTP